MGTHLLLVLISKQAFLLSSPAFRYKYVEEMKRSVGINVHIRARILITMCKQRHGSRPKFEIAFHDVLKTSKEEMHARPIEYLNFYPLAQNYHNLPMLASSNAITNNRFLLCGTSTPPGN
ncbi:unnamed protein product [Thelazia callipaeda]|uniref:Tyrosine-protein phosphatase domain-containing protein n=1 Tax=Thelazia callipaeda TaxID=103827 RepID=A0A0N5CLV9_THECL|nr:unnamed protein product [Thelazia callipaeda]